jgi:hypothetical protein
VINGTPVHLAGILHSRSHDCQLVLRLHLVDVQHLIVWRHNTTAPAFKSMRAL